LAREPISRVEPDHVSVRGRDLTGELMGAVSFTEYFHLLLAGREPTEDERYFLDLLLVAIAEHGMMPSNVAARMTLAADPTSFHGAVAAGILGAGPVLLGTSEACALLLVEAIRSGEEPGAVAARLDRVPGFGHPVHRRLDPRAERIFELADERGVAGVHVAYARGLRDELTPLPLNVSMAIAAVLLDLGFDPAVAKAVPILARTAGLLAHLADERESPIGFELARAAEHAAE
jgi:citrate synthase